MALYINGSRVKINVEGGAFKISLPTTTPVVNNTLLLSSDSYVLIDSSGTYLTVKEDGE